MLIISRTLGKSVLNDTSQSCITTSEFRRGTSPSIEGADDTRRLWMAYRPDLLGQFNISNNTGASPLLDDRQSGVIAPNTVEPIERTPRGYQVSDMSATSTLAEWTGGGPASALYQTHHARHDLVRYSDALFGVNLFQRLVLH